GGIIFSSKQPYAGRENYLNPTAKHPDPYIVPIDEIVTGFNATNAAAENVSTNFAGFLKRLVNAYGLGKDVGEIIPLKINKNPVKINLDPDTMNAFGFKTSTGIN